MLSFKEFTESLSEALVTFGKPYPKFNTIVIMAGGAGSGKGWIKNKLIGIEGWVFDVDRLKVLSVLSFAVSQKLKHVFGIDPEYLDFKNTKEMDDLHNILDGLMELNSKYKDATFRSILTAAPDRKPNLIFDVTLKDFKKFEEITSIVTKLGYSKENINIVWVLTDVPTALEQNKSRDRRVSDDLLATTHQGVSSTMKYLLDMGEKLQEYMNGSIVVVFNNKGDIPIKKSESGGSFITSDAKNNYITLKEKGKTLNSASDLPKDVYEKIKQYAPVNVW